MNIFQLQCFLTVANTLSFAKAAEQLNVSQPTITHQIKTLENELNVKLFRRSTRFVEITAEGKSFFGDARSIVSISERAKQKFSTEDNQPITILSIGCSSYVESGLLSEILYKLSLETPRFHPRLIVAPQERLLHFLETEQVDIIFNFRPKEEWASSIKYRELSLCSIACVCRYDHTLANKDRISLPELSEEPLIFCDPTSITEDVHKSQLRMAEQHTAKNIHFTPSIDNAIALTTAGIGISFLPDILSTDTSKLAMIPLEDSAVLSYGIFYKSFPGDSLLKRFIHLTREYFKETFHSSEKK